MEMLQSTAPEVVGTRMSPSVFAFSTIRFVSSCDDRVTRLFIRSRVAILTTTELTTHIVIRHLEYEVSDT